MPESLEPKMSLGRRIRGAVLHVAALVVAGYAVYLFLWGGEVRQTISSGELRQVITDFREKRRLRMITEVEQMRPLLNEMRAIRDGWRRRADLRGDPDETLTDVERRSRGEARRAIADLAFHDVYDTARAVEQDMITLYREFLAARLMGLGQGLAYAEAYEHAATPRPTRPPLDTQALYRDIATVEPGGGLAEFRDEVRRSVVEVREMQENCDRLLAFTRKSTGQANDGISVDMSAGDVALLGYRGPELMPDEIELTHNPDLGHFNAIPGRRLVTGERTDEWLYVDTWYIIGPFPGDRRRENLDVRFGPEANVNLDDAFSGREDRKIRWEYKKVGWVQPVGPKTAHWKIEPRVVSTYAIYYGYTEIYSDAPRQIWIATATDDYGKLWINDDLVWKSPKARKPYNATENIQLVDLKQGQNKVLYRVENAGGTMGFSLLVRLAVSQ
jgi:hypothetical protein